MAISSVQFIKLENLGDRFYEVETTPKKVKLDLPIQVAFFVYNYAKLRMLEFYYDFLLTYFDRKVWQFCEIDTDSADLGFSSRDWMSLMKPELAAEYWKQMEWAKGNKVKLPFNKLPNQILLTKPCTYYDYEWKKHFCPPNNLHIN